MADLKLNTTNGSVTLKPEDGSGNVDVTIPRAGVGKVLQIQHLNGNSSLSTTSTSFFESDMFIDFTPKSSTSKILITVSYGTYSSSNQYLIGQIRENGNIIGNHSDRDMGNYDSGDSHGGMATQHIVTDSLSTSSRRYAYYIASNSGGLIYFYRNKSITVMEIAN